MIAGTVILMLELSQVLGIVAIVLGVLEFVASFALRNKKASTILTWINFILLIAFVVIYFYLDSKA